MIRGLFVADGWGVCIQKQVRPLAVIESRLFIDHASGRWETISAIGSGCLTRTSFDQWIPKAEKNPDFRLWRRSAKGTRCKLRRVSTEEL